LWCAEKYLPALKCLLAAQSIDEKHAKVHEQSIRLRRALEQLPEPLPEKVQQVMTSEFLSKVADSSKSLEQLNEDFLLENWHSAPHVQAGVRLIQVLHPELEEAKKKGAKHLQQSLGEKNTSLRDAEEGLRVLEEIHGSTEDRETYVSKARELWPEATVFQSKGLPASA
jgi:N-alpha-acetyltransferase 15/16, NatA auxiliary subunit